jgi:hypothetical protein
VTPTHFDCGGECRDGTCRSRCIQYDDVLRIVSIDGDSAVFENETWAMRFGTRYACRLSFDSGGDAFDCRTGPKAGDAVVVGALGGGYLDPRFCTGAVAGGFMPHDYGCSWDCVIDLPDPASP